MPSVVRTETLAAASRMSSIAFSRTLRRAFDVAYWASLAEPLRGTGVAPPCPVIVVTVMIVRLLSTRDGAGIA
jgi:hypothetical protein